MNFSLIKVWPLILALPFAAGCATRPAALPSPPVDVADRPAAAPVDVGIEWGWRIVGDAAVRPVQVFSLNGQTYLHMRDRRPLILLVGGEVVPFQPSWPYLVIQGEPDRVDIVMEGYRAIAERMLTVRPAASPVAASVPERIERGPVSHSGVPGSSGQHRSIERVSFE